MVKVELIFITIVLLAFTGNTGGLGTNNISDDESPMVQWRNATFVGTEQISGNESTFPIGIPLVIKTKRCTAERRGHYRNLYERKKQKNLRKNISDTYSHPQESSSATTLDEHGKPIHKAVCELTNNFGTFCANLRTNPLLHFEYAQCPLKRMETDLLVPSIKIVDDFLLGDEILLTDMDIKNQSEPGNCTVVIFYARWCNLSAKAARNFNAIPRAFENIQFVAVDTYKYPDAISTFVIYSVPTILLFHNGRLMARFMNESFGITAISEFLEKYTDQEASFVAIQPSDYHGPIPTVAVPIFDGEELIFAWIFILISCVYGLFTKPVFNLFLSLYLNIQSLLDDVEFTDTKFKQQ